MNGNQWQSKQPFSVPVSEKCTQDDWETIFGTEAERKVKMAKAIEEQEARKRPTKPQKCGGGTDAGKVIAPVPNLPASISDMIDSGVADMRIPAEYLREVKHSTARQLEQVERSLKHGG